MHPDTRDLTGVLEPHPLPRRSTIGRAVHAVAVRDVAPDRGFTHSDVDHIRIRRRDRDRAHRAGLEVLVREIAPRESAVVRSPYSTAARAEIELAIVSGDSSHCSCATSPIRSDRAIPQAGELLGNGCGIRPCCLSSCLPGGRE